jgi:hypothetical protein
MTVLTGGTAPTRVARTESEDTECQRMRCLCGKWWAYRSGETLILRCKLCRREIVIRGENLTITYR